MKPLNREARTLIDSACAVEGPSEAYRERMRGRLAVSLGGAMAASTAAVSSKAAVSQTGVAKVTGVALWVKAGTFVAAIGVFSGGAALLWPDSGGTRVAVSAMRGVKAAFSTPRFPEALPAPSASPPVVATGKEQNDSVPVLPARARQTSALPPRAIRKAASVAPTKADNALANNALNQELLLLSRAQASLSSGDADRALALLDAHATTYPNGALREERMAARVFALCALGRQEEARAEAQRFVSMAPRSPLAARVRGACSAGESSALKRP